METEYNGELRKLYGDIDKRLTVLESNHTLLWNTHDREAKEHREYVHNRFHDIMDLLTGINLKLQTLPCEVRIEKSKDRIAYVDAQIKAIWGVTSGIIMGVLMMAWRVLFNSEGR